MIRRDVLSSLSFEEQIRYSKYLLTEFFRFWRQSDESEFSCFARSFVKGSDIVKVLDRFIDGDNDSNNVLQFVSIFRSVVDDINEKITALSEKEKSKHSVKIYSANWRQLQEEFNRY